MTETADSIHAFWFGAGADEAAIIAAQSKLWWAKDAAVDAAMRARFGALLEQAADGRLDAWASSPRGVLALILLTDQFTRNIHRGTPQSFAFDALARRWAAGAVAAGLDSQLAAIERVFLYLPFEHAEDLAMQDQAVALFEALVASLPAERAPRYTGYLDFARRHREVIARFGRFPHRNAILGRASTAQETEFLAQPGSSF